MSKDGKTITKASQTVRPRGNIQFLKRSTFPRKKKKKREEENQYINSMYLRFLFSLQHKHQQKEAELKYTSKHKFQFPCLINNQ